MEIVSTRNIIGQVKGMNKSSVQNSSKRYWKSVIEIQLLWCRVFLRNEMGIFTVTNKQIIAGPFDNKAW